MSNKQDLGLFKVGISSTFVGAICPINIIGYPLVGIGLTTIGIQVYDTFSGGKYKNLFKNCGLYKDDMYPKLVKKRDRDYGYDLLFTLPLGMCTDDFKEKKKRIEQHLNADINIEYVNKMVLFKVKDKKQDHFYPYQFVEVNHPLEIVVGVDENNGNIIKFKLDSQRPHVLVGGETGGGKTVWIITLLVNIIKNIMKNPKFNIDIDIVDFKRVDYTEFYECKHIKNFVTDMINASMYFSSLRKEMNRRLKALEELKCRNIDSFNKRSKHKMKYKLIIIDEFADITTYPDKDIRKRMINNISEILRKARAVGIHVIGATQKPTADSIPTAIKGNMPVKIAFRASDGKTSEVILNNTSAKRLRGKGHGIYKHTEEIEFQSMFIDDQKENAVYDLIKESCIDGSQEDTEENYEKNTNIEKNSETPSFTATFVPTQTNINKIEIKEANTDGDFEL